MKIWKVQDVPKEKIIEFFRLHWGSPEMVISSGTYDCSKLDGFTVLNENQEMIGLVTLTIDDEECEIISLDSIVEGKGIGSSLVQEVEKLAKQKGLRRVKLVTTNDNLHALKFYQKRGYLLSKILNNAVEKARKIKPEIPLIGNDGIPIRDEIEMVKELN